MVSIFKSPLLLVVILIFTGCSSTEEIMQNSSMEDSVEEPVRTRPEVRVDVEAPSETESALSTSGQENETVIDIESDPPVRITLRGNFYTEEDIDIEVREQESETERVQIRATELRSNRSDRIGAAARPPLYVVNGEVTGSDFDATSLQPKDIASIEVLKEASAAAKYGARGANGVVLITTRN